MINGSRCDTKKLLFRKSQPIRTLNGLLDIEIQVIEKESTNCEDFYAVVDWTLINVAKQLNVIVQGIGRGKVGGVAAESRRQLISQFLIDRLAVEIVVIFFQEEHHARAPVVVRGHF